MPARMWRRGVHKFLELFRPQLPDLHEHMLSFVYLSYHMTTLLIEKMPDVHETWLECLGDPARYRMGIGEAELRDEEIWLSTARNWYHQNADLSPNTGGDQYSAYSMMTLLIETLPDWPRQWIEYAHNKEGLVSRLKMLLSMEISHGVQHSPPERKQICGKKRMYRCQEYLLHQGIRSLNHHRDPAIDTRASNCPLLPTSRQSTLDRSSVPKVCRQASGHELPLQVDDCSCKTDDDWRPSMNRFRFRLALLVQHLLGLWLCHCGHHRCMSQQH